MIHVVALVMTLPDKPRKDNYRNTPDIKERARTFPCNSPWETIIMPVSSARDRVLILDSTPTYNEHFTKVVSKCTASLVCEINQVKHILDEQSLIKIVNAIVFSRMYKQCKTLLHVLSLKLRNTIT